MKTLSQLKKNVEKLQSKQLFATFYSPGTFVSESTSIAIRKVDLKMLLKKAKSILERYGAKPYGFRIEDGNGKELSGIYYITGTVLKYDEIPKSNDTDILRANMKCNNYPIVVENRNSYCYTSFFNPEDKVIDWDGRIIRKGDDADLLEYRKTFKNENK